MKIFLPFLALPLALFAASPWVNDHPDFVPGKNGEALRFEDSASRLFLKLPGYFNLREGTLQFRISPLKDATEIEGWGTVFSSPSDRKETAFTILSGNLRSATYHGAANAPPRFSIGLRGSKGLNGDADWKRGEWHSVAYTWGPKGRKLYLDGKLIDSAAAADFPYLPEYLAFGGGVTSRHGIVAESALDDIELSDMVRSPEYITSYAKGAVPVPDAHTLAYHSCDRNDPGYAAVTAKGEPAIIPDSGLFGNNHLFAAGEARELGFHLFNPGKEEARFQVSAEITDYYGGKHAAPNREFTLKGGELKDVFLPFSVKDPGWYAVKLFGSREGKALYSGERAFVILPPPPEKLSEESLFGSHLSEARDHKFFRRMGIRWERDMRSFLWKTVEPLPGEWSWNQPDRVVREAKEADLRLIAILGTPPRWAAKVLRKYNASSVPRDHQAFREYVFQTVSRYKGQVKYWEIYNEPDWIFGTPGDLKDRTFAAPTAEYLELLKIAHEAIKAADPEAVVVSGGFVPHPHLINHLVKNDGGKYFDLFGMHRYRPWARLAEYAKLFPDKPVWQTEHLVTTPEDVAEDVFQTVRNGFKRNFFFDTPLLMTCFTQGAFEGHGWYPQKPVFAIAQCVSKLEGKTPTGPLRFDRLNGQILGELFDGGKITQTAMLYSLNSGVVPPRIAFVAAADGVVEAADLMGKTQRFPVKKGERGVFPLRTMVFVEGPFDPEAFTVEPEEKTEFLQNADFRILSGDIGMDKAKGMLPAYWHCEKGKGSITVEEGEIRSLRLENSGAEKENVRIQQILVLDAPGYYELSGEYMNLSAEGENPMPYLSVIDRSLKKELFWFGRDKRPLRQWSAFKRGFRIEKRETEVLVMAGVIRQGTVLLRNLSLTRRLDPEKLKRTAFAELGKAVNLNADFSNLPQSAGLHHESLSSLPTGIREFQGDLYRLAETAPQLIAVGNTMPESSREIPVNAAWSEIRILSTAIFVTAAKGEELGACKVHYADGTEERIPLRRGTETDDWYSPKEVEWAAFQLRVPAPRYLYRAAWSNPQPGKTIRALTLTGGSGGILIVPAISGLRD